MRCQQVESLLDAYLAGQLETRLANEIELHLDHCPACSALLLPEDAALDALLASDWYATSPSFDLTTQVMSRVTASRVSWKHLWWVAVAWSGYVTTWLLISLGLLRTGVLTGLLGWHRQLTRLFAPLTAAAKALWHTLRLVQLSPAGCILLLLLVALSIYGLRRLEREGLA